MANRNYLDELGVEVLIKYFTAQIAELKEEIALLNKQDGTPGSIRYMIDSRISDFAQDKGNIIYGGSASDVLPEEVEQS